MKQTNLLPWGVAHLRENEEHFRSKRGGYSFEDWPGLDGLLLMEPPPSYNTRYIDLRSDFGFKHIFGKEAHKDLLIDFLNSLFEGRKTIRDIEFRPTERLGEDEETRTVIYDILCTGEQGEYFLIEMQRIHQDFFEKRSFHYASRLISGQVPAGKAGDSFSVKEVYVIGMLDFIHWNAPELMDDPVKKYIRSADVTWTDTREPFNQVEWIFIQLPAFDKEIDELESDLERWIYLLNQLSQMEEPPPLFKGPIFRKLFEVAKIDKLTKEEFEMYTLKIDVARDWRNAMSSAKRQAEKEGRIKGLTEGRKEGRKEGLKEGRVEGFKEGERNKTLAIVKTLIEDTGFDDKKIASFTGVEESQVRKIRLRYRM